MHGAVDGKHWLAAFFVHVDEVLDVLSIFFVWVTDIVDDDVEWSIPVFLGEGCFEFVGVVVVPNDPIDIDELTHSFRKNLLLRVKVVPAATCHVECFNLLLLRSSLRLAEHRHASCSESDA